MPVGVRLPGTTGNYVSTPDHASLDITGDLCLVAHVALDDWTPALRNVILSKFTPLSGQRSYLFQVQTSTGALCLVHSVDGTAETLTNSTVTTGFTDGTDHWIAVTLDVNNGASNSDVKFWTSSDGSSWSQLGSTVSLGAITSIHSSATEVEVGANSNGSGQPLNGTAYYAAVYDGIGANTAPGQGTLVAEWSAPHTGTRYRDSTGKVWTLNGSAYSTVITP